MKLTPQQKADITGALMERLDEIERGNPQVDQLIAFFGRPAFEEFKRQHRADLLTILDEDTDNLTLAYEALLERRSLAVLQFVVAHQASQN